MLRWWRSNQSTNKTNTCYNPLVEPTLEELATRTPLQLSDWELRAYRWRRAERDDAADTIYPLDLARFTGAVVEELLDLRVRVSDLEAENGKTPSVSGEG